MSPFARALPLSLLLLCLPGVGRGQDVADRVRLVAVEYARSDAVPADRLLHGASPEERVGMSFYFFVLRAPGRVVLIDCGTDALAPDGSESLRSRWSVTRGAHVLEALARLSIAPTDVTDIVLTHHHWDHVGALHRFPNAAVHVQASEWARVPAWLRRRVEAQRRLRSFRGSERSLFDELTVRVAGRHTRRQLMVEVRCRDRSVVLAGDAAYLYRSIEGGVPSAVSVERTAGQADIADAVDRVGRANVLPGHDPALFERFPSPSEGVAVIC